MTPSLVLGSIDADHLAIVVHGRSHPGATDYWDGNWVRSTLRVRAGGFTAHVTADLRTDEIHRFGEALKSIDDNLAGAAVLQSMEDWITLSIQCNPNGGLAVSGEVMDQPGVGNRLAFELHDLDQTHLPTWLSQVSEIELRFPVVGEP
ncbi:MAG: WapI family immunity protein [Pseudonocardiaceae bacterium]